MFARGPGAAAVLFMLIARAGLAQDAALPPEYDGLTQEQGEETDRFVVGNAVADIFHESGHMLVSEFSLPVLGKEEDAVDSLSSLLLLEGDDPEFDQAMMDGVNMWFLSSQARAENGGEEALWDEHGLDEQRAYAMVCMMLGKDMAKFKDFATEIEYPADRMERCPYEYEKIANSWYSLLGANAADEGATTQFNVTYEEPSDPKLAHYAEVLKNAGVLEMIEATYSGTYALKDGIKVSARSCGVANAFWSPSDREITLCYELSARYAALNAKWYRENPDQ